MKRVCAVVVTYNRLSLLKACIDALKRQSAPCDLCVVDNASTDGTHAWLTQADVPSLRLETNLGGAGGFNRGIRYAVEKGYDFVWLMDDDTLVREDALERLLEADATLGMEYGWLSSVALWTDGSVCLMNRQKLKKGDDPYLPLLEYGILQAQQATFVSLFLPTSTIRKVGNVIQDFFIWGDDVEYTRRISIRSHMPCFLVGKSKVVHAMKENNGSSISIDSVERLSRYHYAFRNENYLYRQEGLRGVMYYYAKCGLQLLRIVRHAKDARMKRIWIVLREMIAGLFFNPPVERFG